MNLSMNRQGLLGRWYLWSEGIWTAFSGGAAPNGYTNLCRTFWVLVGAPFVILWQVAAILGAIAVVGPLPYWLFGGAGVINFYYVAGIVVATITLAAGVLLSFMWFWTGDAPGGKLAIAIYHGIKDRFCPTIKLEG